MEWINYNHLFYFWTVARHGSVSMASSELQLSQPTISEQVRKLEEALGVKLFERAGRGLRLSEAGDVAFRYAEEIFRSGRELRAALSKGVAKVSTRFAVGITNSISELVAHQLLAPAIRGGMGQRLICVEDRTEPLLARLALHQLDAIISDAPLPPGGNVKASNHRLARCGVSFIAIRKLRRARKFPQVLDGAPFLMPEANTALHNALQNWFDSQGVRPTVVGEFSGNALLENFGREGLGFFAIPTMVEREARLLYKVEVVGRCTEVVQEFYAITTERRLTHPSVAALVKAASHQS
jgi:LysR family transcriptional activator of nhaA